MPLRVAACSRARVGGRFSKRGSGGRGAASTRRGGAPRSGNFWLLTNRPRAKPGKLKVCGNPRGSSGAIEYFRTINIRTRGAAAARISDLGEGTLGFSPAGPSSLPLGGARFRSNRLGAKLGGQDEASSREFRRETRDCPVAPEWRPESAPVAFAVASFGRRRPPSIKRSRPLARLGARRPG